MPRLLGLSFIGAVLLISLSLFYLLFVDSFSTTSKIVEINKGSSVKLIGKKLKESGVIRSEKLFLLSVLLKRAQNNLRAGEYEFDKGISLDDVVDKFVRGEVRLRKVLIPEGKNIYKIGAILEDAGIINSNDFINFVIDKNSASSVTGVNADSFEGYLFPDTYFFPKGMTAKEISSVMTNRFKKVFQEIKKSNQKTSLTDHEIVTLASLIEKETGVNSERQMISAVFHNRLRKGMKLQCDPTVIYGIGPRFNGNITKKDLITYTPYNTYTIFGLPPGPIANPGKESIYAALNPSNVDFLFFVAKGDGTHVFSRDYKAHLHAVNKYIRNINN